MTIMTLEQNKKVGLSILILIVLAGIAAFVGEQYGGGIGKLTFDKNNTAPLEAYFAKQVAKTDSDGDGLYDWEETLWQTNPVHPDTDGDGTTDGDEVNAGRNPLVSGPQDELTKTALFSQESSGAAPPATVSQSVSRELFSSYLALRQSGEFSEETGKKTVQSIVNDVFSFAEGASVYSLKDISTTPNTQAATLVYANTLQTRISDLLAEPLIGTELTLLKDIVQAEDKIGVKKFDEIVATYRSTAGALATISVPQAFMEKHLMLLNTISDFSRAAGQFRNVFTDPVQAMAGLRLYFNARETFSETLQDIDSLLASNGVMFDAGAGHYIVK